MNTRRSSIPPAAPVTPSLPQSDLEQEVSSVLNETLSSRNGQEETGDKLKQAMRRVDQDIAPFVPMPKADQLIVDRAKTHGDYELNAETAQSLKRMLHQQDGWLRLSHIQRESLENICTKLGRIMAGDPNVAEHWDDIAGYARLVAQRLL